MQTDLIQMLASMTAVVELLLAKGVLEESELRDTVARHAELAKTFIPA